MNFRYPNDYEVNIFFGIPKPLYNISRPNYIFFDCVELFLSYKDNFQYTNYGEADIIKIILSYFLMFSITIYD